MVHWTMSGLWESHPHTGLVGFLVLRRIWVPFVSFCGVGHRMVSAAPPFAMQKKVRLNLHVAGPERAWSKRDRRPGPMAGSRDRARTVEFFALCFRDLLPAFEKKGPRSEGPGVGYALPLRAARCPSCSRI